jgi:hypothetical protein
MDSENDISSPADPDETEMQETRHPINVNINIMGLDTESEEGKKKLEEIMNIIRSLVNQEKVLATVKKTEQEQRSSQQ